jgi:hypothetical protein
MKGQEPTKMVPLKDLQIYKSALDDHHETMVLFFKQYEKGYMPMPSIESLSVNPLVDLHTCLSKILKDNNILSADNS